eukprot:2973483-Lingulodinium_polyedra.AAC.1
MARLTRCFAAAASRKSCAGALHARTDFSVCAWSAFARRRHLTRPNAWHGVLSRAGMNDTSGMNNTNGMSNTKCMNSTSGMNNTNGMHD